MVSVTYMSLVAVELMLKCVMNGSTISSPSVCMRFPTSGSTSTLNTPSSSFDFGAATVAL